MAVLSYQTRAWMHSLSAVIIPCRLNLKRQITLALIYILNLGSGQSPLQESKKRKDDTKSVLTTEVD